jgi:HK97 family phage portal protein
VKARLPFIGTVKTGKDAEVVAVSADKVSVPQTNVKDKEKFFDLLGGILDISTSRLSNEKTVSNRLLQANREWVYRNNDVIAQEVSAIEFELYQVGLSKGEIVYTEIEEHPLLGLLDKFNLTTTRADGLYNTQSHKKLTGDAFWLLRKNGSQIDEIYVLQPDKVTLNLGDPNTGQPLIKSYTYKDTIDAKTVEVTYQPEEIIHFKKPNPTNPYRGKGVVEALAETIDSDNLANLTQKNFFRKGAITNFVLTTDGKITPDQLKRLKADLKANNGGAENAFEMMILSGGLKPASVGYSNKDLQLIDLLTWYRDKIMVQFGNTPASIGIIEDVNQANANATLAAWKRGTIKPDMDSIVNTLNEFLVPMFGKNLVLGYVNVVPEDRTDDILEATQLKNAGIITINEARELLEYESVDGGDTFAPAGAISTPDDGSTPETDDAGTDQEIADVEEEEGEATKRRIYRLKHNHGKKLGKLPAALAHLDMKTVLRRKGMFSVRKYNHDLRDAVRPTIRKMIRDGKTKEEAVAAAEGERLSPHFTNDEVMDFYNKQIHTVDVLEGAFEKAIVKFIKMLEDQALHNFDSQLENKTIRSVKAYIKKEQLDLFDDDAISMQAQIDLTPILMNQVVIAGQAAYDLISKEDTYIPFNVTNTVQANVAKFTQSMLDTDRETMSNLILEGLNEGLSVPQIRNNISEKFDDISKKQSTRIARTEVMRASNMGNLDAYKQSGVVEAKQWLTAGATDECASYEGKTETLDGSFYSSDSEFMDGDPPLHPNCRCVLIPVVTASADAEQPSDADVSDFQEGQVVD